MAAGNEESAVELADQIRALEDEAQRYTIDLRLQAIDRDEWHQKVDQFTERDTEAGTAQLDLAALSVAGARHRWSTTDEPHH